MIVAAGLTPAWQHILAFEDLAVGEVNRARESQWCASGKVLNAAVALRHLEARVRVVAPLGGIAQEPIATEFESLGILAHWIVTQSPTRVCTTLLDDSSRGATELVENQPPLSEDERTSFVEAYGESVARAQAVVLTGSLPAGTPTTFYAELLAATPCPAVIDARGPELLAALEHRPWLVKPNREELGRTLGRTLDSDDALREAMSVLHARGAQWVLITDGSRPAWLASSTAWYRLTPPTVERVVNAIGCGDCLAGALAWATAAGHDAVEATRLAMGAAADNLATVLPGRLSVERVRALASQVTVEPLS